MPSYCLKCRKNIENINQLISKTSNGKKKFYQRLAWCAACNTTKSGFIKNQEARNIK